MEEIQYLGEHLWPARIGQLCIIISFLAALWSAISYAKSTNNTDETLKTTWKNYGRFGFILHGLTTFTVIGLIFYVMINQYYEYYYVQSHVSDDLPMRYIFSAFWEGQEGSFLLWMVWHIVLGLIILLKKGKWEAPVLSILAAIEVFLASMLLGVHLEIGEESHKIGSNPILLLRDMMDAPIFNNADYVSLIKGTGLNPLLQNYWMTIHPPTLFLGFASTSIPFCFAIAGLWTRQHKEWLKPALKWALFSGFILGTGILMGAAWAYEALTFGGYWAWDPVENSSLVPWIILVAGIHTNLISKVSGQSIRSTYLFYILCFLLILYSTFLTRSGILGDSSVHAFTDMGLEWQLVGFIGFFIGLSAFYLIKLWSSIPAPKEEEKMNSREFWMFIGSLVLFFSAVLISISTSLPVFNKIISVFKADYIGMVINDPVDHYNRYQLWIAIFIAVLSGVAQLLRYDGKNWELGKKRFIQNIAISSSLAIGLTYLFSLWINLSFWFYFALCFAAFFSLFANGIHLIRVVKFNMKQSASVISHLGFAIMILGILSSGLGKSYITTNPFAQEGLVQDEAVASNVILIRDEATFMNGYWVNYQKDTMIEGLKHFVINFRKVDENGETVDSFEVLPNMQMSNDLTKVAAFNPYTKRYFHKDIFTHVSNLPKHMMDIENKKLMEDTMVYNAFKLDIGDTLIQEDYSIVLKSLTTKPSLKDLDPAKIDLAIGADIDLIKTRTGETIEMTPALALNGLLVYTVYESHDPLAVRVKLNESFFNQYFTEEQKLDYQEFRLKAGQTVEFEGYLVGLVQYEKDMPHRNYEAKEGDIAVGARLQISSSDSNPIGSMQPLYIIRDNSPFTIKDHHPESGIHARFKEINPENGEMLLALAIDKREFNTIPIDIAEDVPRSDIILLESIEFPGINLFWLGSVFMMIGLLIGLINRKLVLKGA